MNAELHVKVIAPTETFYDGPAVSISAKNKVGPFDILSNHANFFSLLTEGDVIVNTGHQQLTFPIFHGILKVTNNTATLFVYLPD
jgi:F0F1-type ATP synthase epsilon subunit